jgi:uncharacterized protein (DUF952 family)
MSLIYHITTAAEWKTAQQSGEYSSPALKEEGFIHCSEKEQVEGIKERFYPNTSDLLLLTIDTEKLESQLIFEWSPSVEQTFPHIYGPINLLAVVDVKQL